MQLGEGESLWPVLAAVKWIRSYHAAAATPLEPEDILFGKLSWVVTRAFVTGIIYTIVIGSFGALESWWSLTLPFIGALIALAFSAPLVAFAARSQSDAPFSVIYRFAFVQCSFSRPRSTRSRPTPTTYVRSFNLYPCITEWPWREPPRMAMRRSVLFCVTSLFWQ